MAISDLLLWVPALLLVPGLLLCWAAVARLRQRRLLASGTRATAGAVCIAIGGLGVGSSLSLHTYERFQSERPVAVIVIAEIGPQRYRVDLEAEAGGNQRFVLAGDEWQLDARVLSWRGPAVLAGMDSLYRLERLSGRYRDVAQELSAERTVYALAEDAGLDLWALARDHGRWLPFVDARYGSATYLPLADGARYRVSITQRGLVARPANPAAEAAMEGW